MPKNSQKALEFWQKACLLDDAMACFNAGLMYEKGEGVEKAYDKLNI